MRKLYTLLILAIFAITSAWAAVLQPMEALEAACSKLPTGEMLKARGGEMRLVKTYCGEAAETPAVYLFSSSHGYILAAADDASTPLLGYGLNGDIDPDAMPPAMEWWISQYAQAIASGASIAAVEPNSQRSPIAPMLSTAWGQEYPFNIFCPNRPYGKTYAGSGPVAMAQICKYYNWPDRGQGSNSYGYWYFDNYYTEAFDFDNNEFDYSHMRNRYSLDYYEGGYDAETPFTDLEAFAVAKLMRACGVAAEVTYGYYSTTIGDGDPMRGMTDYLRYRADATQEMRIWHTDSEWSDMLYEELSSGRPVLYQGMSGGPKMFVCDGCNSSGMFYFNWGWGGYGDGFFELGNLSPYSGTVFTGHEAIFGLEPNRADEAIAPTPLMGMKDPLVINGATFSRQTAEAVVLSPGFYNMSHATMALAAGFLLVKDNGDKECIICAEGEMAAGDHLQALAAPSSSFPVGEYDVYPAFKGPGGEWQPIRCVKRGDAVDHFRFAVTETEITVTEGAEAAKLSITPRLLGMSPAACPACDGEPYTSLHRCHTYNFDYEALFNRAWSGRMAVGLFKKTGDGMQLAQRGNAKSISMTGYGAYRDADDPFSLTVPADLDIDFRNYYYIALYIEDGDDITLFETPGVYVTVDASPHHPVYAEVFYRGELISPSAHTTVNTNEALSVAVTSQWGTYWGNISLKFERQNGQTRLVESDDVNINSGETATVDFDDYAYGLANGAAYYMSVVDDSGNTLAGPLSIKIVKESSIDAIGEDPAPSPAEYYNLQGIRIPDPAALPAGTLLIERRPSGASKIKR